MKVATVTLHRKTQSAVLSGTYIEEVRGFSAIIWAPSHVVFEMNDDTIIAYQASRIHELVTNEE
jgi:hypothetical protein